jgi:site-specific DNA recombinase
VTLRRDRLVTGDESVSFTARAEFPNGKSERSIRMTLSLAFIAPPIVVAAIEGRLPRGFGAKRLMDLPMVWSHQWTALGLKVPA